MARQVPGQGITGTVTLPRSGDAQGNVLNRYTYDIWGNPLIQEEQVPNNFRYSGEYWDEATNLQYLRARWYDPSIGRFINEDTYEGELGSPLSLNLYTYVHNNPLIYRDSTGHAIDNIQLNTYLQIARAEGVNSQVYWEIRSILGSEVSGLPGNIANNNKSFKYLFSLATGTYYEKKANTLGNAQWAEGNLQKMFELAESLENVSFAMLSTVGGKVKKVSNLINTTALIRA